MISYSYIGCLILFLTLWLMTYKLWNKIKEKSGDGKNTKTAWFSALVLIIISYIFIFMWPRLYICPSSYDYLLSSINQSLATLFAIVFSLMFILTQISKGSGATNNQVSKIFTEYVLIYIIVFVITIISSLYLIGTREEIPIRIVLFLAVFNVTLLIPFFWRFKITTSPKEWWRYL